MPKRVTASIPAITVHGGLERRKEIYVLGFALDQNSDQPKTAVVGAYNQTDLAGVGLEQPKGVTLAMSNLFPRVSKKHPVSLSGSGILLYPNLAPGGMLALHILVVESDAGARRLANTLRDVSGAVDVASTLAALSANPTTLAIAAAMGALVRAAGAILRRDRDDILLAHGHSGFDFDDYGLTAPNGVQDFKVANDRCSMTLRIRCS